MYSGKSPRPCSFKPPLWERQGTQVPDVPSRQRREPDHRIASESQPGTAQLCGQLANLTYYGWQNSLRKRFSRSFSFDVNYTWSKALSNGGGDTGAYYDGENSSRNQEFFDLKADRGPTVSDITHYFSADWVYQLPALAGQRAFCGMWRATGSSQEFSPLKPVFPSSSPRVPRRRVSGATTSAGRRCYPITNTRLRYLNPAAFQSIPVPAPPAPRSVRATISPGALRAPGLWNLNFSLAKNFSIIEKGETADPHRTCSMPSTIRVSPDCERASMILYSVSF